MIRGLYTAVSGLITQEAKQDVISNNIANVNTTGFKEDNLAVKSFNNVLIQNSDKIVNGKNVKNVIGSMSLGSQIDEVSTNFTEGTLQSTNSTTDFAIDGKGFFTVSKNTGGITSQFYTRDGHFHVNSQGMLVNDGGDSVLGVNNSTNKVEPIYLGSGTITADSDGNISVDNTPKYRLNTVDFDNYKELQKVGDNLFTGGTPKQNSNVKVVQNSLEGSNINVMSEMVNMMTVMRAFETNQKVVQAMDETLDKTVNQVGTVK